MTVISDILLAAGAIGAALYCLVLSRRLSRFSDLEKGMGGAIAVLSVQVDDMTKALSQAQGTAKTAESELDQIASRAETAAKRLELLLAAMHDLPEPEKRAPATEEPAPDTEVEEVQWRTRRPVGGALR